MNNQYWIDSLNNNLSSAYNFYKPKHWTEEHNQIWKNALQYEKQNDITEAFGIYYGQGSHMPKPAEIKKIIREGHPVKTPAMIEHKPQTLPECNLIIQAAWIRFNSLQNRRDFPFRSKVDITDDQAVLICNMEAKRRSMPYAIEKMFWIEAVWGEIKVEFTDVEKMEAMQKPRSDGGVVPDYQQYLVN